MRTAFGGDMRVIEYSKERDLYGRDKVVEKKAYDRFVSLEPDKVQRDLVLSGKGVRYIGVGRIDGGARFIVIFLHGGGGGSRFQAVDDWLFGGNFNRLKNLVTRNDGVYLSPDFNRRSAGMLGGVLLLGSLPGKTFFATSVFADTGRHIPIYIGHGTKNTVFDWVTQEMVFKKIKTDAPDYPVRFDAFVNGHHGTPMRLVDWRRVLNWMIESDSSPPLPVPRPQPSP